MRALCLALLAACDERIGAPLPPDDRVTSVVVTPASINMNVGDTLRLFASLYAGAGQKNRRVKWTTTNPAVVVVDSGGVITSVGVGIATVTATSLADTTVKGVASITVGSVLLPLGPTIVAINHDG